MPMRLSARALHVEAEQQHALDAPDVSEAHRLKPTVAPGMNVRKIGREALAIGAEDPMQTVAIARSVADSPQFATKATRDLGEVRVPPRRVARVENIRPRREQKARVDDYGFTAGARVLDVRFRKRRATRDNADGLACPSSG